MLKTLRQFKLIQAIIVFAVIAFGLRLVDVVSGVSAVVNSAMAESQENPKPEELKSAENPTKSEEIATAPEDKEPAAGEPAKAEPAKTDAKTEEGKPADAAKDAASSGPPEVDAPKWRDASDNDIEGEAVRMELIEDMAERRKAMDEREKAMITREALIKAAEKELDRKYQELTQLKTEIEKLLQTQSDEEKQRLVSIVKIYESMKAKEAARIFDTLDLDVLVTVMSQMSERKLSPILAAMNPERARTITIMLAEQKKLPELPQN